MSGRRSRAPHGDAVVRGAARGGDARGADHLRVNDGAVGDGVVSRPTEARICGAHPGVVRFPPRARRASARARRGVRDARGPERRPGTHRRGGAGDGRHGDPGGFSRRRAGPYASATGGEGRGRAERVVVRASEFLVASHRLGASGCATSPRGGFSSPARADCFSCATENRDDEGAPGWSECVAPRMYRENVAASPAPLAPPRSFLLLSRPSVRRSRTGARPAPSRSFARVRLDPPSPPPAALRLFGLFSFSSPVSFILLLTPL